ncbi:MAG: 5-formyltetrahydrofolate cyclo-ligase [Psychroserpens sp.]|nr:5-formyltetrahydrofolate cyclo-ligase [Psychroserpens sp.]
MTKPELRKIYKNRRSNLSDTTIEDHSLSIANQLLKLPIWGFDFYHLFLSIQEQKEINTEYILNILAGKDKNTVISKSDFLTLTMSHILLTDNTVIKKNSWNIPEPVDGIQIRAEQIDVVFVPLLAFDEQGNRVGYGKGFYDRFLKDCKPETLKIGLSFFESTEKLIEADKEDVMLDFCVTPDRFYQFK